MHGYDSRFGTYRRTYESSYQISIRRLHRAGIVSKSISTESNPIEEEHVPTANQSDSTDLDGIRHEIASLSAEIQLLAREVRNPGSVLGSNPDSTVFEKRLERPRPLHRLTIWFTSLHLRILFYLRRWRVPENSEKAPGPSRWWDVAAIAVVLLVAIPARFVHLSNIPNGIHGDEAMAALQGKLTWDVGWRGVWNPEAGGFPAGFIYLAAPMTRIFGVNIMAVRYLSAGLDVITVLLLYSSLRRAFGYWTGLLGAILLAVSAFQIQFARIAFPNILWPTLVMAGVCLLVEALRRGSLLWWSLSGLFFGLAIYSYNAQSIYLVVLGLFFAWLFVGFRIFPAIAAGAFSWFLPGPLAFAFLAITLVLVLFSPRLRQKSTWLHAAAFGITFSLAMYGMVSFILDHRVDYFGRSKNLSFFRTDAWTSLSTYGEQIHVLMDRYWEFWVRLSMHPVNDAVDGSGAAPFVPLLMLAICLLGIPFAIARRWHPLVMLGILTLSAAPVMSFWSADFALRRSMIVVPFICMFAAICLVETVRLVITRRTRAGYVAIVLAILMVMEMGWRNYDNFFNQTVPSNNMNWVMSPEWVSALETVDSLGGGYYAIDWGVRWPWGHETQTLIAPDVPGETRGAPFGPESIGVDYSKGRPVVILFFDFQNLLPEYQSLYPGGQVIVGPKHWDSSQATSWTIYVLPPLESS